MVLGRTSGPRLLVYLLYAVLLTSVLLVVRFPKEKVLAYAEKKIEASVPGSKVNLSRLSYDFPLGVHLGRLQVADLERDEDILLLEDITVTPKLKGLGFAYQVTGEMLGGDFATELSLSFASKRYSLDALELKGLDLSRSAYLAGMLRRDLQGILEFTGSYSSVLAGSGEDGAGATCDGVVGIASGGFALRQPVLTLKTMDFESLDVAIDMQGGVVTLTEGVLEGGEIKANFGGVLNVADTLQSWKLNLEGGMVPSREYLQGNPQLVRLVERMQRQYKNNELPYTINGTVANPRFRFGGKN